jgi:SAM-dependent methyltransferase
VSAQFDRFSADYEELVDHSIAFGGREHGFYLEAKAIALRDLVRRRLGDPSDIRLLDVGCGLGLIHPYLEGFGELHGVDPSPPTIERARSANPHVQYHVAGGDQLPFASESYDVTTAIALLHHVPLPERAALMREVARVTRAGGLVVVFEHNPINPLTRLVVARCSFDEYAVLLRRRETARLLREAGIAAVASRYILFFPWRTGLLDRAEHALRRLPLGAQYYVAGVAKGSPTMRRS